VRKGFDYDRSLAVLRIAKEIRRDQITKAGLILGMGETTAEVREALQDLKAVDVDLITLGQYLAPSRAHPAVDRYVTPEEFDDLAAYARSLGFAGVTSGPLVRSSYHAKDQAREQHVDASKG